VLSSICFRIPLTYNLLALCEYCRSIERFRNLFLYQYLLLYFLAYPLMPDIFEFHVLPHCHLGTILKLGLHFHRSQTVPSAHVVEIPYLTFLLVTYLLFCLSLSCARQHLCLQQQNTAQSTLLKKYLCLIYSLCQANIKFGWLCYSRWLYRSSKFFLQYYDSIFFSGSTNWPFILKSGLGF